MSATVLLQGITPANHEAAIMRVLALPNPERVTIGVAFLNARGLQVISHAIARVAPVTTKCIKDETARQAVTLSV